MLRSSFREEIGKDLCPISGFGLFTFPFPLLLYIYFYIMYYLLQYRKKYRFFWTFLYLCISNLHVMIVIFDIKSQKIDIQRSLKTTCKTYKWSYSYLSKKKMGHFPIKYRQYLLYRIKIKDL